MSGIHIDPSILKNVESEETEFVELDLSDNRPSLNDDDVKALVASINKGKATTYLDLSMNKIGNIGLADLSTLSCLEGLNLTTNIFNDEGVGCIANLPKISYLNISENKVTPSALIKLIKHKNVTTLLACFCSVGDSQELEDAINENYTLLRLELKGNEIDQERLIRIESYIERNKKEYQERKAKKAAGSALVITPTKDDAALALYSSSSSSATCTSSPLSSFESKKKSADDLAVDKAEKKEMAIDTATVHSTPAFDASTPFWKESVTAPSPDPSSLAADRSHLDKIEEIIKLSEGLPIDKIRQLRQHFESKERRLEQGSRATPSA